MNELFRIKKYIEYQWKAKTKYYLHSPFVYQFYLNVLEGEVDTSIEEKQGKLLYRLTKYFNLQNILIVGDSGSISKYFKLANQKINITSKQNSGKQIQTESHSVFDLILFDNNFSKETILEYFHQSLSNINQNSIFILKDIYGSKEINKTWKEIKAHPQITLTLDIFQFGICFFRKGKLAKENFVLRY